MNDVAAHARQNCAPAEGRRSVGNSSSVCIPGRRKISGGLPSSANLWRPPFFNAVVSRARLCHAKHGESFSGVKVFWLLAAARPHQRLLDTSSRCCAVVACNPTARSPRVGRVTSTRVYIIWVGTLSARGWPACVVRILVRHEKV